MSFLARDVTAITGVKRQRLQAWLQEGLISPSIHIAEGHGDRNIWDAPDLYKIAIFKKLVEIGLQRKPISELLKKIPNLNVGDVHACFLLFMRKKKKIVARMINKTIEETNQNQGPVVDFGELLGSLGMASFDDIYVINFQKIKSEIDKKIKESHKDFFGKKKL